MTPPLLRAKYSQITDSDNHNHALQADVLLLSLKAVGILSSKVNQRKVYNALIFFSSLVFYKYKNLSDKKEVNM